MSAPWMLPCTWMHSWWLEILLGWMVLNIRGIFLTVFFCIYVGVDFFLHLATTELAPVSCNFFHPYIFNLEFTSTQICGSKKIRAVYCRAVRNAWTLFECQLSRSRSHSRRMTVVKSNVGNLCPSAKECVQGDHTSACHTCKVTRIPPQRGSRCGIESMRNIFELVGFNHRKWTSLDFLVQVLDLITHLTATKANCAARESHIIKVTLH